MRNLSLSVDISSWADFKRMNRHMPSCYICEKMFILVHLWALAFLIFVSNGTVSSKISIFSSVLSIITRSGFSAVTRRWGGTVPPLEGYGTGCRHFSIPVQYQYISVFLIKFTYYLVYISIPVPIYILSCTYQHSCSNLHIILYISVFLFQLTYYQYSCSNKNVILYISVFLFQFTYYLVHIYISVPLYILSRKYLYFCSIYLLSCTYLFTSLF